MASGFPSFTGWLLIAYSAYIVDNRKAFIAVLLVGRFLTGAASGISGQSASVSSYESLKCLQSFWLYYMILLKP